MSGDDDITFDYDTDEGDDITFAIETAAAVAVTSVNDQTGDVQLDAADVGADPAGAAAAVASSLGAADAALDGRLDAVETTLPTKADLVGGVVPTAQLPPLAVHAFVTVANQAARLALTTAQVQPGDEVMQADQPAIRWTLAAVDPSQPGSWLAARVTSDVVTVNGQAGAVVLGPVDVGADAVGTAAAQAGTRLAKASNLADLSDPAAARTALGLGNVATRAVGTSSGQVRDAADAAYSNPRTPTSHAGTHALGGTDVVTPAAINAVSRVGGGREGLATNATASGGVLIDLALGNVHALTLTGNVTSMTVSGAAAGNACWLTIVFTQDGTGSRTIAWPSSFKWPGGSIPVLSTAAGAIDVVTALSVNNGTLWIAGIAKAYG